MTSPLIDPTPEEWLLLPYLAQIVFRINWRTKGSVLNSSWDPGRTVSNAGAVPCTSLVTAESTQTGQPLTVVKSLFSANHKARLSSFIPKITTDYQEQICQGTTDSSANVCAGCGTHFVWAAAQRAPLGEMKFYRTTCFTCFWQVFLLLIAVHLLSCHF